MTGKPSVLVGSASATHGRPWELGERYVQAINRSHSDLVKFAKQDEDYEVVRHHLQRFSKVAVDVVQKRFKEVQGLFLRGYIFVTFFQLTSAYRTETSGVNAGAARFDRGTSFNL